MKTENQKQLLYEACAKQIQAKIDLIEERLKGLEESRNNETKSTAGDKYETGRAMMQIEIDNCKIQLLKAQSAQNTLEQIGVQEASDFVKEGSLIETNKGVYFLSIALGKLKTEAGLFFCISKNAPIAKALFGKKVGESITFNGSEIKIKKIN